MTQITVYHKPNCVQCQTTIRRLEDRGLAYTAVDLTLDPVAMQTVWVAGHRGAPVIAVDGQITWSGFRPDLIDALAEGGAP